MASLAGKPVPVLRFMLPQWIPWGYPVLFCGRGSIGKTTLACQLARYVGDRRLVPRHAVATAQITCALVRGQR